MFNAGRCLETGQGVDADILKAGALYETAARGFGHFDAVHTLGGLYDDGALKGGPDMAVQYLLPAAKAGQWAQTVRDGFERYLDGDVERAFLLYAEAAEYGYPAAAENAAYLADRAAPDVAALAGGARDDPFAQRAAWARYHHAAVDSPNSWAALGDDALDGGDLPGALAWYSKAAAAGSARGLHNVGWMYENAKGVPRNVDRARRYYDKSAAAASDASAALPARLSLARLRMRELGFLPDALVVRLPSAENLLALGKWRTAWRRSPAARHAVRTYCAPLLPVVFAAGDGAEVAFDDYVAVVAAAGLAACVLLAAVAYWGWRRRGGAGRRVGVS